MKAWLINNYGELSRIVGDIIGNLSKKTKPLGGNRKDKFIFCSAITGAIQRLERLSRANYIDKSKLESCLLSWSTLSSLVRLLPTSEHDLWVREMTVAGLDFKNPVGIEMLNCFKQVCIIECNTNKSSRLESTPRENKVQQIEGESSDSENETSAHAVAGPPPKPWSPPSGLKFSCPLGNHKHKGSTCAVFSNLTPLDRWKKIEKGRMCYSCLKPKTVYKGRKCNNVSSIPEVLKCAICAPFDSETGERIVGKN